jgi:hypothetical protein
MPLTPVQDASGLWNIRGVTPDPAVTAPLGRVRFNVGAHWIGFDDRFSEPVVVRCYYDPTADPMAGWSQRRRPIRYVGYLQFMRLSFRGTPIPPSVYGGRLADRQPYVYGREFRFIDFMGPREAAAINIEHPFYPFNAYLGYGDARPDTAFFVHPLANGSLCSPADQRPDRSLVASLAGEIAPGLITPADVSPYLTDDALLVTYQVPRAELAATEPYRYALNRLKTASPGADPAPLAGLDSQLESQIEAQVIGDYVLLTLPDDEDFGHTLCVSVAAGTGGNDVVRVHLLSSYDTAGMRADAARAALQRIKSFEAGNGGPANADRMEDVAPAGRGRSGLNPSPYTLNPQEFVLELRYWTLAVAYRERPTRITPSRQFLSGITWSALFQFDDDTGQLSFGAISEPQAAPGFEINPGLSAYRTARTAADAARHGIDPSNFTKAAMRRENFGAGTRLRFVDASGTDIPT